MRPRGCEICLSAVYISSLDVRDIFFVSPVYSMLVEDGRHSDKSPPAGAAAPQTGSSALGSQTIPRSWTARGPPSYLARTWLTKSQWRGGKRSLTAATQSEQLSMTRCAVLFNRQLGVPMVSSSFTFYRDVFLFALAVRWGIDVALRSRHRAVHNHVRIRRPHAARSAPTRRGGQFRLTCAGAHRPFGSRRGAVVMAAQRPRMQGYRSTTCRTRTP